MWANVWPNISSSCWPAANCFIKSALDLKALSLAYLHAHFHPHCKAKPSSSLPPSQFLEPLLNHLELDQLERSLAELRPTELDQHSFRCLNKLKVRSAI